VGHLSLVACPLQRNGWEGAHAVCYVATWRQEGRGGWEQEFGAKKNETKLSPLQFTSPKALLFFLIYIFFFYPLFSPLSWYPLVSNYYILSHRYNSRTGSGETKVKSHETQPNQAALLLNTASIQPVGGNTVHLVGAHCTRPATQVTGARWDNDIPTGQTLPNPDDARPIVAAGCDRAWARTQSLWWHSDAVP
jgi:hypothetical protein